MSGAQRLPPGQHWTARDKWPLVGERVLADNAAPWTLSIAGRVRHVTHWTLDELSGFGSELLVTDIHCVTRWSRADVRFKGLPLERLLALAGPLPSARFVLLSARSPREHDTSLPLADAVSLGAFVAWEADDRPLSAEHGGPLRLIVPGRYFYKSLKWLMRIELLAVDRLGFWERTAGYHNHADPWRGERFSPTEASAAGTASLLAGRSLVAIEVRGLAVVGADLKGLDARQAVLRNADFSGANLGGANFERANLSAARFVGASLSTASFCGADVEGADFARADLRGTNFSQASLLGVSLGELDEPASWAIIDASTRLDAAACEQLTPDQQELVARARTRAPK